jgi:transmembrane sensor
VSDIVKLRTRAEIEEQAAQWTWRLDSETLSAEERQTFELWLHQDVRHRQAFEEMSRVWGALDGLAEAKRDERIATFSGAAGTSPWRGLGRWWLGAAATLAVVVGGVIWLRMGTEALKLATAVGQQRNVTLIDGSIVTLNTNTIVETDLRRTSREIFLRKGEAHFQVAHDGSRPFFVHAGDAVVRAVGTEFEVRLRSDQHVDVTVNEGRVEVQAMPEIEPQAPARSRPVAALRALRAGEKLSTAIANYPVKSISPEELSSDLAWREGAIFFDGEPLATAVAEIGRYTDARIVVSDPRIAALPVGGRFRTDDVQGFFDALQAALPVAIRRTAEGFIYIDPRR